MSSPTLTEAEIRWKKWERLDALSIKRFELKAELEQEEKEYRDHIEVDQWTQEEAFLLWNAWAKPLEREIRKVEQEINWTRRNKWFDRLNDEQIRRASEVLIQNLIQTNGKRMICCPFHEDHRPSCSIRENRFHCFGCEEKGDAIDFYMKLHDVEFPVAVRQLAGIE